MAERNLRKLYERLQTFFGVSRQPQQGCEILAMHRSLVPSRVLLLTFLISFSVFPESARFHADQAPATPRPAASQNAVLVELFTSEGCSTCPPADALLDALQSRQPIPGAYVIGIEEHVDYWNAQGWSDPYSSSEWTERQRQYTDKIKGSSVYTPQTIVDGQQQFVGSHESEVETAIRDSAARAKTAVTISSMGPVAGGEQVFDVRVGKLAGNTANDTAEVWLAITEQGTQSSVRAGENAGKDLRHAPVLRLLRKVGIANAVGAPDSAFAGSAKVKMKAGWKQENLQAVAFVQERKSWRILGAAVAPPAK